MSEAAGPRPPAGPQPRRAARRSPVPALRGVARAWAAGQGPPPRRPHRMLTRASGRSPDGRRGLQSQDGQQGCPPSLGGRCRPVGSEQRRARGGALAALCPLRPWLTHRAGWPCCAGRLASPMRRRSCTWMPGGPAGAPGGHAAGALGMTRMPGSQPQGLGPEAPPRNLLRRCPLRDVPMCVLLSVRARAPERASPRVSLLVVLVRGRAVSPARPGGPALVAAQSSGSPHPVHLGSPGSETELSPQGTGSVCLGPCEVTEVAQPRRGGDGSHLGRAPGRPPGAPRPGLPGSAQQRPARAPPGVASVLPPAPHRQEQVGTWALRPGRIWPVWGPHLGREPQRSWGGRRHSLGPRPGPRDRARSASLCL